MCFEDIAIQRATKTRVYLWRGVDTPILANPLRLAIRLVLADIGTAWIKSPQFGLDGGGSQDVILTWAKNYAATALNDCPPVYPQSDVTLKDVGDILLGPLFLGTDSNGSAWAIESYLDTNHPSLAKYNVGADNAAAILKKLGIGV